MNINEIMELGIKNGGKALVTVSHYYCNDHLEAVRFVKKLTGSAGRQRMSEHYVWHANEMLVDGIKVEVCAFLK